MKTEFLGPNPGKFCDGSVLTIGNFDGVHGGHRHLIAETVLRAHRRGLPSLVLTFHPHPRSVLRPDLAPAQIYKLKQEQMIIAKLGIDYMVVQKFDRQFANLNPEDFMQTFLMDRYHPAEIIVGQDFAFGKNRSGSLEALEKFAASLGVNVILMPPVNHRGEVISSTRIRKALAEGNVTLANELLVDPYFITSKVVEGRRLGSQIGIPTANISLECTPLKKGVYVTRVEVRGRCWNSVSNLGTNPTVNSSENNKIPNNQSLKLESHIFDFHEKLYGETIEVRFLEFVRDEKKFSTVDELKKQIQNDILFARAFHQSQNYKSGEIL